ncbi:unnamed protein product [Mytilus coruscus]|uniref:Uncharacterized protein n=1 Tax=Mytilus coruscus TaxID=42192 RepID=A0A6J8B0D2_MYTCO|nr:unnamed protein product [Mytilus coruscus]
MDFNISCVITIYAVPLNLKTTYQEDLKSCPLTDEPDSDDVNNSTINDVGGDSTQTILGEISTAKIMNKDITGLFQKNVFQQGVVIGKEKFPNVNWDLCDQVVLQTKVNRVVEKIKTFRKNNKAKLNSFLEQDFYFPVKKPVTSSFEYLQENERKRVKEIEKERNRAVGENVKLKRQLKETDFTLDNLELQTEHFETKSHILLRLLDIARGNTCEKNESDLDRLKKDKRSLLVKVCRMSKQQHSSKFDQIREEHLFEIQNLKVHIAAKQDRILEVEDLNSILADDATVKIAKCWCEK